MRCIPACATTDATAC